MAGSDLVQALLRGLDVLQIIGRAESGVRLSEVAHELGVQAPTVHNLVRTLAERGFVSKGTDKKLRLGPAVLELAQFYRDRVLIREASGILQQLVTAVPGAVVTFAEVVGADIQLAMRISPDRPNVLQTVQGQSFSAYANASGLVIHAFADDALRADIRDHQPFHEFGAHLWNDLSTLEEFLEDVRAKGYAIPPFPGQESLRIAAPVRSADRRVTAALGVSRRKDDSLTSKETLRIQQCLLEAAANLTGRVSGGD